MANTEDVVSEVRTFSIKPFPRPIVEYPADGQEGIDVTPVIRWETFDEGFKFRVQISTNSTFSGLVYNQENIEGTSLEIPPGTLFTYSTYYLRMQAMAEDTVTLWSDYISFSTVNVPPDIPAIVSPEEGEMVTGPEVTVTVKEDLHAKAFTFQISQSESFPWNDRQQFSIDAPGNSITFDDLTEGSWYVKARAAFGNSSYTDWSEAVMFTLLTTSNTSIGANQFSLEQPVFPTPEILEIRYTLQQPARIQLYITSITGKRMAILRQQYNDQGKHIVKHQTPDLVPGIYLLTLETDYGRKTVKLIKSK